MPPKAALLKRKRSQRIPFRPGNRYSNKGRIHSRRPILSSSLFACKTAADHTFRIAHNTSGTRKRSQRCSPGLRASPFFFLLCPTRKRVDFRVGVEMFNTADSQSRIKDVCAVHPIGQQQPLVPVHPSEKIDT